MKSQITILNLSDLHINWTDAEYEVFERRKEAIKNLPKELLAFYNKKEQAKWNPDYIVMPGDIIDGKTKNPEKSYEAAQYILEEYLSTFGLKEERIIAVPGNHDRIEFLSADMHGETPKLTDRVLHAFQQVGMFGFAYVFCTEITFILLVAKAEQEDVEGQGRIFGFQAQNCRYEHREQALHIECAAAPQKAIFYHAFKGVDGPVLTGYRHHIHMTVEQDGRGFPSSGEPHK